MSGEWRGAVLLVVCLDEGRVGMETEEEAEGRREVADQLWKAGMPIIMLDCENEGLWAGL